MIARGRKAQLAIGYVAPVSGPAILAAFTPAEKDAGLETRGTTGLEAGATKGRRYNIGLGVSC